MFQLPIAFQKLIQMKKYAKILSVVNVKDLMLRNPLY